MEITALAIASATIIAQGFLGEAGKNSWDGAARLLSAVRNRFRGDQNMTAALTRVEGNPGDSEAVNILAIALAATAERDEQFRQIIGTAVEEARQDRNAPQAVRNYSDFRDANIEKVVNIDTVHGNLNF
ncbi:hypothetical protein [Streptomyces sp. MBT60]|uniref:hypothetical protein n=1 Tax=Streptomyces sp. MBT60 TaxID=2800409 RepID=UPI00190BA150|nr:hypothetical protein [Streptomyces sp. MBT60]